MEEVAAAAVAEVMVALKAIVMLAEAEAVVTGTGITEPTTVEIVAFADNELDNDTGAAVVEVDTSWVWVVRLPDPLKALAELVTMMPGAVETPETAAEVVREVDAEPVKLP